jgi:hypothetical protein
VYFKTTINPLVMGVPSLFLPVREQGLQVMLITVQSQVRQSGRLGFKHNPTKLLSLNPGGPAFAFFPEGPFRMPRALVFFHTRQSFSGRRQNGE